MRQLSYHGHGRLTVDEVSAPPLRFGEIRVRIDSVGICKSDIYGYTGVNGRRDATLGPGGVLVMGHEASGYVEEVGPGADGPPLGTAVAVNPIFGCGVCRHCRAGAENLCSRRAVYGCVPKAPGAFADSMVVRRDNVYPLAPGTPIEWGALLEPLAVGAHGVSLAGLGPESSVLVIGGGVIGIGAALAAQRQVGENVIVLEPLAARRALCEGLGLSAVAPENVAFDSEFDVAIDCVAREETLAAAIRAVPARGLVVLVGIGADAIGLPVGDVVGRETRIFGSYGYSQADFADLVQWLRSAPVDLSPIIERTVGFDEIIPTFDAYADGSLNAVRVLLRPAP
jgi:threonine dehydrogenase-like Zn-dependent dehydrogenase